MNTHLRRFLLLGGIVALPFPAYASTLTVGTGTCGSSCSNTTIQGAINAASAGDTIEVWPGTYNENLVIDSTKASNLTIMHARGTSGEVQVNGGASAPVLEIMNQSSGPTLSGLRLTNGKGVDGSLIGLASGKFYGGGVYIQDSSPTLESMRIDSNTGTFGAGVFMIRSGGVIRSSYIASNTGPGGTAGSGGGGIYLHQDSEPTIENTTIINNSGMLRGGGIYMFAGGSPQIIGSTLRGNSAYYGGGMYLSSASSPVVTGTLIRSNTSTGTTTISTPPGGGGVYLFDGATPLFVNTTLADNLTAGGVANGVELYSYGGSPRFLNSIIANASNAIGKTLLFGQNLTDVSLTSQPSMAGIEMRFTDLCKGSSSCTDISSSPTEYYGGSYSASTVVSIDGQNAMPSFVNPGTDYHLDVGSALADVGSPDDLFNDIDNSRADLGAFGGPLPNSEVGVFADVDGDGMDDVWEGAFFGNTSSSDGTIDSDSDGLVDVDEYNSGTRPDMADTDRDGYSDAVEHQGGSSDPLDPSDHRPMADIGRDRIAVAGSETVSLDASRSYDPDGTTLSYSWSLSAPGGSSASLSSGSGSSVTFSPDITGVYEIRVTVTDTQVSPASSAASTTRTIRVFAGDEVSISSGIQSAINSAIAYRTITVAAGTYAENLDFGGKNIRVRAASGGGNKVIAPSSGSAVSFKHGEGEAASLEGFILQGGTGTSIAMSSGSYVVGGGVLIQSASPTLRNLTITSNTAALGGGMAILSGAPQLEGVTVTGNTASSAGGGLYIYGGAPSIMSSVISSNSKTSGSGGILGGGLFAYASNLSFGGSSSLHSVVASNTAVDGGGVYLQYCDRATMRQTEVHSNTATGNGGGIYLAQRSILKAVNAAMMSNQASGGSSQGGAGYLGTACQLSLKNSSIGSSGAGNTAVYGGAFALSNSSSLRDSGSTFAYNTASQHGGVLYNLAGYYSGLPQTQLKSSVISHNSATSGDGGVMYVGSASRGTLIKATITSNTAGGLGGVVAVHSNYDQATVKNCLIVSNTAGTAGGALYAQSSSKVYATNNTMVANSSTTGGAIASYNYADIQVRNSIISHTPSGYAISATGNVTVLYSNIYSSSASAVTGYLANGSSFLNLDPTYVSFNAADPTASGSDFHLFGSGNTSANAGDPDSSYNDLDTSRNDLGNFGGPDGELYTPGGDADADGMADDWEVRNFGNTSSATSSSDADSDGLSDVQEYVHSTNPMVADSDADGVSDNAEVTNATDPLSASDNLPTARAGGDRAAPRGVALVLDGGRSSDPNRDTLSYSWKFVSVPIGSSYGTANVFSTAVRPSFTPDIAGVFQVALKVNDTKIDSAQSVISIHVPASDKVVGSGQAYTTIQSAIDAASDWDVIMVKEGTYTENVVLGTRPLTVMSESGAKVTTISASSGSVVTSTSSPSSVVLKGFTVTGGTGTTFYSTLAGGGLYLNSSSAVIEDCIVRNNTAYKGAGVLVSGGAPTLVNNQIVNNAATGGGGGIWFDASTGAVVMNNVVAKNSATSAGGGVFSWYSSPKMVFNTFAANSSASAGNLYLSNSQAEVRNNIIANSLASGALTANSGGNTIQYNLFAGNYSFNAAVPGLSGTNLERTDAKFNALASGLSGSALADDFRLQATSPAVDAADADLYYYRDPAGGTADMGAFGGPRASSARTNIVKTSASTGIYGTIATALTTAISGDSIKIYGGTYSERVSFGGKNISIIGGIDGMETIIDGASAGSVVTIASGETSGASLSNVTLQHGSGTQLSDGRRFGGGLYISGASPVISRVTIKSNSATVGAGAYLYSSAATLENLTVISNSAGSLGGGIALSSSGSAMVSNSVVAFNSAGSNTSAQGGGLYVLNSDATLENLLIQENVSTGWGGGLISFNSAMALVNAVVVGNQAASSQGGGVFMMGSTPEVRNSIIAQNINGGLLAYPTATPTLAYSDFYGNTQVPWYAYGSVTTTGLKYADPLFADYSRDGVSGAADSFHLQGTSTLIDAGETAGNYDVGADAQGTSRNDMGIYGGPGASSW